jgi:hypothetical protein
MMMEIPEILQAYNSPIDGRLIADKNDSDALFSGQSKRFQTVRVELELMNVFDVIRTIDIYDSVSIQKKARLIVTAARIGPNQHGELSTA